MSHACIGFNFSRNISKCICEHDSNVIMYNNWRWYIKVLFDVYAIRSKKEHGCKLISYDEAHLFALRINWANFNIACFVFLFIYFHWDWHQYTPKITMFIPENDRQWFHLMSIFKLIFILIVVFQIICEGNRLLLLLHKNSKYHIKYKY